MRTTAPARRRCIEAIDGTFTEIETAGGFEDETIPDGYCPFGIQAIGNSIFVTYALADGIEDVAGQKPIETFSIASFVHNDRRDE